MAQPTKSLDLTGGSNHGFSQVDGGKLQSDFTVECGIKFNAAPTTAVMYLLDKWLGGGNQREWQMFWHSNGSFYGQTSFNGSTTNTKLFSYPTTSASTWYHFAFRFDLSAGTMTIYRAEYDGTHTLYGTMTGMNTSIFNSSPLFYWFTANGTSSGLNGKIHDFRIWDSVRTVSELDDNFKNASLSDTASGLLCRLRMEDDLTDATSNGDDGTATGSPTYSTDIPDWGGEPPAATFTPKTVMY